jgi:hypothetical protein
MIATHESEPLIHLQDAGFQCAAPRIALNRSGVEALGKALEEAEKSDEAVVIIALSPDGQRVPITIQPLGEISRADAIELVRLQVN